MRTLQLFSEAAPQDISYPLVEEKQSACLLDPGGSEVHPSREQEASSPLGTKYDEQMGETCDLAISTANQDGVAAQYIKPGDKQGVFNHLQAKFLGLQIARQKIPHVMQKFLPFQADFCIIMQDAHNHAKKFIMRMCVL